MELDGDNAEKYRGVKMLTTHLQVSEYVKSWNILYAQTISHSYHSFHLHALFSSKIYR